jgi:hypothetical protein
MRGRVPWRHVDVIREVFRAIETRNGPRLAELLDPEV